jgi:hypothetical protein
MILMRCHDCGKIRKCGLPSSFDTDWLNSRSPRVDWRCKTCYWVKKGEMNDKTVEVIEERHYLIRMREVVPFLGSIAAIVMICLEVAWHT